jgi:hypothetical protein
MSISIIHRRRRGIDPFRLIGMHHLATTSIGRLVTEVDGISQGITIRICCRDVKRGCFAGIIQAGWRTCKTVDCWRNID